MFISLIVVVSNIRVYVSQVLVSLKSNHTQINNLVLHLNIVLVIFWNIVLKIVKGCQFHIYTCVQYTWFWINIHWYSVCTYNMYHMKHTSLEPFLLEFPPLTKWPVILCRKSHPVSPEMNIITCRRCYLFENYNHLCKGSSI